MERIIEGKMYNSETAEGLLSYDNGLGDGDFRNLEESLFITKKGNFFLCGRGGALTKYSHSVGNSTTGGEGIQPLTREDALVWLEEHDGEEVIREHLSDLIEEA